jgi:hypothetical protein
VDDLTWEYSPLSSSVNFLDMVISIKSDHIHTDLFEKSLNLYFYIPPSSCHSSGVINGIILGGVHRIYRLCSDNSDIKKHLINFRNRLIAQGYLKSKILLLFQAAIRKQHSMAINTDMMTETSVRNHNISLYMSHHPTYPLNRVIQGLYEKIMSPVLDSDLCVCVHRTCNLRNPLTYQ